MRTPKISTLLAGLLLLPLYLLQAQDELQAYWVHEDHVKPAMVDEYEAIGKKLISNLEKYEIQDEQWITTQTDDFRYLYVGELDKMADLDRELFGSLAEKMGEAEVQSLFSEMDGYYTAHFDYIIHLDPSLSYMPDGLTQTPEGQDYRKFYYLHTTPANRVKLAEGLKGIKELYERKGSKEHYRVYSSGFGSQNDFFLVAVAAKDPVSYEQNSLTNSTLLGEDAKPAFDHVMEFVTKFEVIPGRMRPDLAYSPD